MSDFKSWDEVKEWLKDPEDNYQTVTYHAWTWSDSWMSCSEGGCCSDEYKTVEDAVETIKDYSGNRLHLVTKNE